MDRIALVVRADGFGLCHAANQAVWEGFEAGVLTCASLMPTGPWAAETAGLARDHPDWEIGLELVLTCDTAGCRWGPAAGAAAVPSLVEADGTFCPRLSDRATAEDVDRELIAQADRAAALGIKPAYLVYGGEPDARAEEEVRRLGERLGIPAGGSGAGFTSNLAGKAGEPFDVAAAIAGLGPGVHLWVVRPAQDSPETWALWPDEEQARRCDADARSVCSPQVMALIRERGIDLTGFRSVKDPSRGRQRPGAAPR